MQTNESYRLDEPKKSGHLSLAVPFWSLMILALCVGANTNVWWALLVALISGVGIGLVERYGNNA